MRTRLRRSVVFALVLTLLVSATATAAVAGDPFRLGMSNTINATTKLVGAYSGSLLQVINTATTSSARALIVQTASTTAGALYARNTGGGPAANFVVNAGVAPFTVNSAARVANLNADRIDGVDSAQLQRVMSGTCANGSAVQGIAPSGAVTCEDKVQGAAVADNAVSALDAQRLDGLDSTDFVRKMAPNSWINIDQLSFVCYEQEPCPWLNHGAPYARVGAHKDALGFVHLSGAVKCVATQCIQTVAYLNTGYRPAARQAHATIFYDTAAPGSSPDDVGRVDILPTGAVTISAMGSEGSFISLDGITFLAAP